MVGQYLKSRGNDLLIFKKLTRELGELCVHWGGGAFKNGDIFKTQGNLLSRGST